MGRKAGSDGGWGVLISSQLFIPVSLHRGEQEGKRERVREREAERGARLLPPLPQCAAAPC